MRARTKRSIANQKPNKTAFRARKRRATKNKLICSDGLAADATAPSFRYAPDRPHSQERSVAFAWPGADRLTEANTGDKTNNRHKKQKEAWKASDDTEENPGCVQNAGTLGMGHKQPGPGRARNPPNCLSQRGTNPNTAPQDMEVRHPHGPPPTPETQHRI